LNAGSTAWSSQLAVYRGNAGAAVGLGSLWRFPYLAGTGGGSAFILAFIIVCLWLIRYLCPLVIAALFIEALT